MTQKKWSFAIVLATLLTQSDAFLVQLLGLPLNSDYWAVSRRRLQPDGQCFTCGPELDVHLPNSGNNSNMHSSQWTGSCWDRLRVAFLLPRVFERVFNFFKVDAKYECRMQATDFPLTRAADHNLIFWRTCCAFTVRDTYTWTTSILNTLFLKGLCFQIALNISLNIWK